MGGRSTAANLPGRLFFNSNHGDNMRYTPEQRQQISETAKGKTIKSMEWEEEDGGYWVITFTDESEMCVRTMAEIANA